MPFVAAIVCSACDRGDVIRTPVMRDSAGVTLVTIGVPDTLRNAWTISIDRPLLVIGVGGDSGGVLGAGTPWSLVELSGGRIAVSVDDSERVHLFDRNGRLLHQFGRRGEGPGEFREPPALFTHGDSIVSVEIWGGFAHVNVFDSAFQFVRSYLINVRDTRPGAPSSPIPLAILPAGELVMQYARVPDSTGRERRSIAVGPPQTGTATLVIDNFDGDERVELPNAGFVHNTFVIFGKTGASAVSDGTLYTGSNDGFTINASDSFGTLRRRLTIRMKPRPVTRALREQYISEELAGDTTQETRPIGKLMVETAHFATAFRFYDRFIAARDGGVWVDRARISDNDDHHYWIFDRDLQFAGAVALPVSLKLRAVWGDTVVVDREDADGVASLEFFQLERRTP